MVVFIVLGAVLYIAVQVIQHPFQKIEANIQVHLAYDTLNTAVATYETNTKACNGELACVTGTALAVAPAFGTFVSKLDTISMPSDARADASALVSEGTDAEHAFEELGAATSVTQYEQIDESSGPFLVQFTQDYQNLVNRLG
jgi:hypothetical protein